MIWKNKNKIASPLLLLLLVVVLCILATNNNAVQGFLVAPTPNFRSSESATFHFDTALHLSSSPQPPQKQRHQPPIVVVGKIIVDEYGDPSIRDKPQSVTVGGGAPQAAMGAALALAARDLLLYANASKKRQQSDTTSLPPPQPVILMAPVGDLDFTPAEEASLREALQNALQDPPKLIRGSKLKTPRIRLWHDQEQVLQWYALNDSFGPQGAGGLWGKYPSISDYQQLLTSTATSSSNMSPPILHIVIEGGAEAPGGNGDTDPLLMPSIREAISYLGVEPVTFPNELGVVSKKDATHCANLLQRIFDATPTSSPSNHPSVVVSPDMPLHLSMLRYNCLPKDGHTKSVAAFDNAWAVRDGPRGSILVKYHYNPQESLGGNDPLVCPTEEMWIPPASLRELVNPTGAGNAYAAAYTALRGSNHDDDDDDVDPVTSACIANSVGAIFCQYNHCPPYTWDVIERIVETSQELQAQVTANGSSGERAIVRRYGEEQRRLKQQGKKL